MPPECLPHDRHAMLPQIRTDHQRSSAKWRRRAMVRTSDSCFRRSNASQSPTDDAIFSPINFTLSASSLQVTGVGWAASERAALRSVDAC